MRLLQNKSLKDLTSFKIGGKAKYFAAPETFDEMKEAWLYARQNNLKTFILGKGSNILFDDEGFSGLVIYNNINFLRIVKNNIYAGGGYSFPSLGVQTVSNNLSGLEFAAGIPASVGGAIYMNASAFGQAISDSILSVTYLNEEGYVEIIKKENMQLGYRASVFQKRKGIILSGCFNLKTDQNAKEKQLDMLQRKRKAQPMNERNAGCIFKNPVNYPAGKLIEECGLKNYRIGGAKVSDLHANFIINEKDASSKDIINLISYIKQVVKMKKNILLEEELKIIVP